MITIYWVLSYNLLYTLNFLKVIGGDGKQMNRNMLKNGLMYLVLAALFFVLAVGAYGTERASGSEEDSLEAKLEAALEHPRLEGAFAGVSVRKADTGEELFESFGDKRLHPASNMKIMTAAAALETLGEDYRFVTEVLFDGKERPRGSNVVLKGDVYLKGKGDPTLMKEDLDQFASDLKAQGVKRIQGDLIADDSWYDDIRLSQDLNWSDETNYVGAEVSALTLSPNTDYDAGTVIVEVTPGSGEKANIKLTPETDYVEIVNRTEMVAAGQSKQIRIEREHGTNRIIVEGKMPENGTLSRSWTAVWDPAGYANDVFRKSLSDAGITVGGKLKKGTAPEDALLLSSKESMPLEELLIPFMKLSNNGHGEVLTKEMGKVIEGEGTWDAGLDIITQEMGKLGADTSTILLRDGSGMSHKTLIPATELSQILYAVQEKDWYPAFEYSLPVAGNAERFVGGTLSRRMTAPPVQNNVLAKTGSLTGVSSLSGYVTSLDGEKLIFSVMINNHIGGSVTAIEDAIAGVLANHSFE